MLVRYFLKRRISFSEATLFDLDLIILDIDDYDIDAVVDADDVATCTTSLSLTFVRSVEAAKISMSCYFTCFLYVL